MSIEVSPADLAEDAIYQASLIPVPNTTTVIKKKRGRKPKVKTDEEPVKKARKPYTKKVKEEDAEIDLRQSAIEIITNANKRHENKVEYSLPDSEISKDAAVTYSKISYKFDKLVGVSDKEHIKRISKVVNVFKNSFPHPAIYNEQTNEIDNYIKGKFEDKFYNTIENNKLIKESLANQEVVEKPKKSYNPGNKLKLTFDDVTQVCEMADNEIIKVPDNVCGLDLHGFIINHGTNDQVIDSLWMNYKDKSFYIVSKLIKNPEAPHTFLENPEDHKLSTFNLSTKNKQIEGCIEIWELIKDVGLILVKTYTHNLGVFKDIQLIPGTFSSFDNEGSKNNVRFMVSAYCTTESVQFLQLDTSPVNNPTNDAFIKSSIAKIKLKNDIISSYCLMPHIKADEDTETLKVCIGSVNGKIYIYDLNISFDIPTKVFKVSESIISTMKNATNTPIISCSSISGHVLLVDTSSNTTNATALSRTRWVSPPVVEYTEYPKTFLYTDGINTLYNSPLNMLDLKSCSANRNSRINCLGISQQHPFLLIGTINGEVSIQNVAMKTLASRKNQTHAELVKMFEWNYDEIKKVYQLDPSRSIEKAYDNLLKPDTGIKYQGCGVMNAHWVQCNSGERYFSFVNYAGITVITKLD